MGLFRKIAGILGFGRDEVNKDDGGEAEGEANQNPSSHTANDGSRTRSYQETGLPRKGFSVPVKVAVERPNHGPVLIPCDSGDGGVQGLRWCAKRLKIDEDGDVAHEFLDEVILDNSTSTDVEREERPMPKFISRYSNKPAMVKNQVIANDGQLRHCVERQGRLEWV